MALSLLPHLMKVSCKKIGINKEIVILTATSGDTGKAALESFANVKGAKIIVFYPNKGISEIQERQMTTQEGDNTYVVAIEGNFDDAQTGVKNIFNDRKFSGKASVMIAAPFENRKAPPIPWTILKKISSMAPKSPVLGVR